MRHTIHWICPRCGWKNGVHRWRCRRCRVKCAAERRLAIATVLAREPIDPSRN